MSGHPNLPKNVVPLLLSKSEIFSKLKIIDSDASARHRILQMESDFRSKIAGHIKGLPESNSKFAKFNTNPFVLLFYSLQKSYEQVSQLENDLVPAKVFSSMETSAGNMVEKVVLPVYGWEVVQSSMHSHESLLDGRKIDPGNGKFIGATLKSGPRTLNDDMAKIIGQELVSKSPSWAVNHGVKDVSFTYGVLYGTRKQSNKKDWHILRNIDESRPSNSTLNESHKDNWSIEYVDGPLRVSAAVRIGIEWWDFLGDENTWIEICCALIRACVAPSNSSSHTTSYVITDLADILDLSWLDQGYNVSMLQRSQFEWLLFLARHFSDGFCE